VLAVINGKIKDYIICDMATLATAASNAIKTVKTDKGRKRESRGKKTEGQIFGPLTPGLLLRNLCGNGWLFRGAIDGNDKL
jgi:hypothetical protein